MAAESDDFSVDLPEPGWRDRIDAVHRAARALLSTRAEIFREELAEKGSLFGQGLAGIGLALAFALLSLILLTALVAAVLAKLLGSAIAGLAVALLLYLVVAAAAALFGVKRLSRVRPLDFPATRDELRKDLDAVREEPRGAGDEPAGIARPDVVAAERASVRPGDYRHEGERSVAEDLEDRFRAGSE
jgi:uncharacterized membrane protein YqjE